MSTLYYESSISHHGVKGQKWGVRRFQNPDGTLTKAGLRRQRKEHWEGGKLHEKIVSKLDSHGKAIAEKGATPTRIFSRWAKDSIPVHAGATLATFGLLATATTPVSLIGASAITAGNSIYQLYKGVKFGYDFGSYKTHVSEDRRKREMKG